MLNYKEIRIGERFVNGYGNWFEIVDYNSCTDIIVKFDERGYTTKTTYQNCQMGNVGCPFDKTTAGVGCIGLKSDGSYPILYINGKPTRAYQLWCSIINRCYNEKQLKRKPRYRKCRVSDRWLVFANFLEDLHLIPNYELWLEDRNYELDKDILQPGYEFKVYSLETCMFVPHEENLKEMQGRLKDRPKKEKPVKMVKAVRVTDIETGVYIQTKTQTMISKMFGVSKQFINDLIKNKRTYFGWYQIEIVEVPESEVNQ